MVYLGESTDELLKEYDVSKSACCKYNMSIHFGNFKLLLQKYVLLKTPYLFLFFLRTHKTVERNFYGETEVTSKISCLG